MISQEDHERAWIRRFDAVARAQARLLWIVLVVTVFYLALQNASEQSVTVPVLEIELSSAAVLAVGGPALSFLLIALVGSLIEWGETAERAFGSEWKELVERYDEHPTAFDLAHYTVRHRSRVLDILAYFAFYPTFLAIVLAEAGSLLYWLWLHTAPARSVLLVVGGGLWLWAARLVLGEVWWTRMKRVPDLWRRRTDAPTN